MTQDLPGPYRYELILRPGRRWAAPERARRLAELRDLGALCLEPFPEYQIFLGTPEELEDKLLVSARTRDGRLAGFSSAVLLQVPEVGEVLHLGLACVHPGARGGALTVQLYLRTLVGYLLRRRPLGRAYVTNVAAVLSSLGNFALAMREAHPSPGFTGPVPEAYQAIGRAFDQRYRAKAHIQPEATWDETAFVFRGSGRGTAFQKEAADARYHHRDPTLNQFYAERLRFQDGDEMLQVGTVRLVDLARYALARRKRPRGAQVQ
jgi:hypothetical protein